MARMHSMKSLGDATNVLKDMATGKRGYDEAAAAAAKGALIRHLQETVALFKDPHADPKSEAKPIIWSEFASFTSKANAAETAATQLDVSSREAIQTGLPAFGQTCSDCHKLYRIEK